MKSSEEAMKKSADAWNSDALWGKKKITKKDEATGEETGKSNTKNVLRNPAWMTNMTSKNGKLLPKVRITVGKKNKLELDEDTRKKTDINTLKMLFQGYNSFASEIAQKADSIGNAAVEQMQFILTMEHLKSHQHLRMNYMLFDCKKTNVYFGMN